MSEKMQFTFDSDKVLKTSIEVYSGVLEWTGLLSLLGDEPKPPTIDYSSITREVSA